MPGLGYHRSPLGYPPSMRRDQAKVPVAYPTSALDRGLRIIQIVRDEGRVRVMDVAAELAIARSSAHRLLQMLVFRDFLMQDADHSYIAGPALGARPVNDPRIRVLREAATPHMEQLSRKIENASNLLIRVGREVRFVKSVTFPGSTYDRQGSILPAHRTAGGRAILSHLSLDSLQRLYCAPFADNPMGAEEFRQLHELLERARHVDFALASGEIDRSVAAAGTAIRDVDGTVVGAVTVSVPQPTLLRGRDLERAVGELLHTRARIEQAFQGNGVQPSDGPSAAALPSPTEEILT